MTRSWKPRDLSSIRKQLGWRQAPTNRYIQSPSVPQGIKRKGAVQRMIHPRPSNSLPINEAARRLSYKQDLLKRYDTDERNRRRDLTLTAHGSHTGKIDSEGFRKITTVKGIPYRRDKSPHEGYPGKRRQYAYQLEFEQTRAFNACGWMGIFGNKRQVFTMRKKQPVVKQVS